MSEVRTDLLSNRLGTGPAPLRAQVAPKAWSRVNLGTTVPVIADSFNFSSVVDIAVGRVGNNLTTAMSSANYGSHVTGYVGSRLGSVDSTQTASSLQTSVTLSNTAAEVDVDRALSCIGTLA